MIDERQRTRLGMLAVASLLMGGGVYGWMWWNGQKAAEAEMNANVPTAAVRLRTPKIASEGQTEANALSQSAGEHTGVSRPATTAATVSIQPGGATTNGAAPNATAPVRIAISSKNVVSAKVEPTTPGAGNASSPNVTPVGSLASNNAAVNTAFKPAANSAPPASITANIRPPVTPANGAALRPPAVQTSPAPIKLATAAIPTVAANAVTPGAGAPIAPENMAPVPAAPGARKATTTLEASAVAKVGMGRTDPTQPIAALLPFPRTGKVGAGATSNLVPPPPNDADASTSPKPKNMMAVASKIKEKLVPPPPPTEGTYSGGDNALGGLPIEQLPVPPSKPMIGDKLRIVAVMDDKAIVSFPTDIRAKNKWPKTITLAKGEQFDSIRVISITPDGVTIEEDGERSLRPVSHIK